MVELVWQILSDWEASLLSLVNMSQQVGVTAPPLVRSQMSLSDCAMKIKMVKCMSQIALTRSPVRLAFSSAGTNIEHQRENYRADFPSTDIIGSWVEIFMLFLF